MRILLLPAYFSPEIVAGIHLMNDRNEDFVNAGFRLKVYAPFPSRGIDKITRKKHSKLHKEILYNGQMAIVRFPMFTESKKTILRALRYSLCSFVQFVLAITSRNFDVLIITSTPPIQGAMAAMVKKVKRIPFVYCLQDIFPDSLVSTGLTKRGSLLWKAGRAIEDFTYRNADKIIVVSQDFKKNIMTKGVPEEKITVIHNWVDENKVVNIVRSQNWIFDKYSLDRNKFYITHCGNIGLTQNMDMLIEVACELESINEIQFVLIGDGAYKEILKGVIQKNNIKNVILIPFQPYENISHVLSLGDASLIISKPGVGENSVPSKLWSIMSAETPVLASFDDNELKQIINESNCGIFTRAGDKEAFRNAILTMYQNRDKCHEMGLNGRAYMLKNNSRSVCTSMYIDIIRNFNVN